MRFLHHVALSQERIRQHEKKFARIMLFLHGGLQKRIE